MRISAADLRGLTPTALVANLPYNVAVPVVLHLLEALPSLRKGLVMVQAEVADRLAAGPGSKVYGVPVGEGRLVRRRTPGRARSGARSSGRPPTSTRASSPWPAGSRRRPPPRREEVFAVMDAAFAQRRKTLRAALAGWAGSPAQAETALRAAGVDPSARGEQLDVHAFARIAEHKP